jgi:hypothetical protein
MLERSHHSPVTDTYPSLISLDPAGSPEDVSFSSSCSDDKVAAATDGSLNGTVNIPVTVAAT